MIDRYTRPVMRAIFDVDHRLEVMFHVEKVSAKVLAEKGIIDQQKVSELLGAKVRLDPKRMDEIEQTTRHDIISFLTMISEQLPEGARSILHYGMTSQDLIDTAGALVYLEAIDQIQHSLDAFKSILKEQALAHKNTLMVGRTHGIHGEPIVFGAKFLSWYAEMERHSERLSHARRTMSVGKMSGAMGTAVHISPALETAILSELSLKPESMATQVVARDRHAELFSTLALIGSGLERIAVEIRHLQRTEVREAEEPFRPGQKGSSAMPHKRNPIGSENITGLARLLRSYSQAAFENVALWHERDISHSSVERVIGPDAFGLLDYMLVRLGGILKDLIIYPERMKQNLEMTRGLVYSQSVLLALTRAGLPRETAYKIVQDAAMQTWSGTNDLLTNLKIHVDMPASFPESELLAAFDPAPFLLGLDEIYDRVLGEHHHHSGNEGC